MGYSGYLKGENLCRQITGILIHGVINKKEKYTDTQKVYKPVLKEVYNE